MKREEMESAVKNHSDMLYRLALMRTGSREEAQDILQQTFLKLVEHWEEMESEEHVKAWLIRTCCNLSVNYLKNPWRYRRVDLASGIGGGQEEDGSISFPGNPTEEAALDKLQSRRLWEAVSRLPERQRVALYLAYMEGYSPGEIAEILHISYNAACMRVNRARRMLKERLEKEGIFDEE